MSEFVIPAPELARLTHNGLAFMPARSAVKVCRLMYAVDAITITATDLFTVGKDEADATPNGEEVFSAIDLSREDLQALDKAARAAKKEDFRIIIRHQDGMEYFTEDVHGTFLDSSAQRQPEDLWERCDELLTRLEFGQGDMPPAFYHLALDPALMGRFGKVKPSNGKECIADLHLGHDDQILVKIGSTFRGAIMPVDRSEAAASDSIGTEGLWHDE